jgi:hypothetical protein
MKRKFALLIVLAFTLLILVVGMQVVEIAEANAFWIYKTVDPIPGAVPPTIIMLNPQNSSVCSPDEVAVSFNVSKPQFGTSFTSITYVYYAVDNGEDIKLYSPYINGSGTTGVPEFNTTFILPSLSTGNHVLTVKAHGVVLPGGLDIFYMNSSSTTFFSVAAQPSLQPSPTPNQSIGSGYLHNPALLAEIVSAIVVVAVASTSLFYFKRHNKRSELRE